MPPALILLGPHRAGKSAVARLLTELLGLPYLHLNTVAPGYWREIGYDEAAVRAPWSGGWDGFYRAIQPFEAHAIERALAEQGDCILEIDSRQAAFDDPELLNRVRRALQGCPNLVMLLPAAEVGWSPEAQARVMEAEGFAGVYRYWERFELHAVRRLLAEHRNCVIDFGAGQSVYEDAADLARVQEFLAPYPNIVLLLPSPNLDESVALLRERGRATIGGWT